MVSVILRLPQAARDTQFEHESGLRDRNVTATKLTLTEPPRKLRWNLQCSSAMRALVRDVVRSARSGPRIGIVFPFRTQYRGRIWCGVHLSWRILHRHLRRRRDGTRRRLCVLQRRCLYLPDFLKQTVPCLHGLGDVLPQFLHLATQVVERSRLVERVKTARRRTPETARRLRRLRL